MLPMHVLNNNNFTCDVFKEIVDELVDDFLFSLTEFSLDTELLGFRIIADFLVNATHPFILFN